MNILLVEDDAMPDHSHALRQRRHDLAARTLAPATVTCSARATLASATKIQLRPSRTTTLCAPTVTASLLPSAMRPLAYMPARARLGAPTSV